jgi:hypothetical protein
MKIFMCMIMTISAIVSFPVILLFLDVKTISRFYE